MAATVRWLPGVPGRARPVVTTQGPVGALPLPEGGSAEGSVGALPVGALPVGALPGDGVGMSAVHPAA